MIKYNQIWCMNNNRIQIKKILKTGKLINLALIRSKFIKDQLNETNDINYINYIKLLNKLINHIKISLAILRLTLL